MRTATSGRPRPGSLSGRSTKVMNFRTLPGRIGRHPVSSSGPARCQSAARRSSVNPNRPRRQQGFPNVSSDAFYITRQAPAHSPGRFMPEALRPSQGRYSCRTR